MGSGAAAAPLLKCAAPPKSHAFAGGASGHGCSRPTRVASARTVVSWPGLLPGRELLCRVSGDASLPASRQAKLPASTTASACWRATRCGPCCLSRGFTQRLVMGLEPLKVPGAPASEYRRMSLGRDDWPHKVWRPLEWISYGSLKRLSGKQFEDILQELATRRPGVIKAGGARSALDPAEAPRPRTGAGP